MSKTRTLPIQTDTFSLNGESIELRNINLHALPLKIMTLNDLLREEKYDSVDTLKKEATPLSFGHLYKSDNQRLLTYYIENKNYLALYTIEGKKFKVNDDFVLLPSSRYSQLETLDTSSMDELEKGRAYGDVCGSRFYTVAKVGNLITRQAYGGKGSYHLEVYYIDNDTGIASKLFEMGQGRYAAFNKNIDLTNLIPFIFSMGDVTRFLSNHNENPTALKVAFKIKEELFKVASGEAFNMHFLQQVSAVMSNEQHRFRPFNAFTEIAGQPAESAQEVIVEESNLLETALRTLAETIFNTFCNQLEIISDQELAKALQQFAKDSNLNLASINRAELFEKLKALYIDKGRQSAVAFLTSNEQEKPEDKFFRAMDLACPAAPVAKKIEIPTAAKAAIFGVCITAIVIVATVVTIATGGIALPVLAIPLLPFAATAVSTTLYALGAGIIAGVAGFLGFLGCNKIASAFKSKNSQGHKPTTHQTQTPKPGAGQSHMLSKLREEPTLPQRSQKTTKANIDEDRLDNIEPPKEVKPNPTPSKPTHANGGNRKSSRSL